MIFMKILKEMNLKKIKGQKKLDKQNEQTVYYENDDFVSL